MKLEIDLVTIFPFYFESPLRESILGKAQKKGLTEIRVHDLRDSTHDRHRTVDAKPFGGGPGMVMRPGPIFDCVEKIRKKAVPPPAGRAGAGRQGWVVLLDPKGDPFTQKVARELLEKKHLILIAGHYEGVDERVGEHLADQVLSLGDFITMGGEAPALCVVEAIVRLVPGVLGNQESLKMESFEGGDLEYPQYTRPRDFRGYEVPEVLVSGHHQEIARWRRNAARQLTRKLLKKRGVQRECHSDIGSRNL